MDTHHSGTWPFPGTDDLYLRPFGIKGNDLYLDFNRDAPFLVTELLQSCVWSVRGEMPDQDYFWDLTFGRRVTGLLALLGASGQQELEFQLKCQACEEEMEVAAGLDELWELQRQSETVESVAVTMNDEQISLRKPTGRDQRQWLNQQYSGKTQAALAMARDLVVGASEKEIDGEWLPAIEEAMAEADPLVNFNLTTWCPACNKENSFELSLEGMLLRKLHQAQGSLLYAVHRLAAFYHWNEDHILALPSWRRDAYLSLASREAGI